MSTARLEAFSDGVIAIIMTIMVLELKVPQRADFTAPRVVRTYVRMARGAYKYAWPDIQRYYDEGHGYLECRAKFGFAKDTWRKAIATGRIVTRTRRWSLDQILRSSKSRYTIKRRLLEAGVLRNLCEECGISEWRGKTLTVNAGRKLTHFSSGSPV